MSTLSSNETRTRGQHIAVEELVHGLPGALYTFVVADSGAHDFRFVSPTCAEINKPSAETAMADARHLHESIHPLDRHSFHQAAQRSLEQMETLRWEGRIVRPDDAIRLVTITLQPQRLDAGDSTLWHNMFEHNMVAERTTLDHQETTSETTNQALALTPRAARGSPGVPRLRAAWCATLLTGARLAEGRANPLGVPRS